MYAPFFGLKQEPFSIAPDPRYLFMSERHREALAHLLYGVNGGGGFVLLSGEIGAGKTTVCRCFLEQIPKRCNVAYIFNPKLTVEELLKSVCDEFRIPYRHEGPGAPTVKDFLDPLNEFLLKTHAVGQNNLLIIDEAQQLSADVLEQLRLLTNLETTERKLLQIVLIGQPELREMLARPELEQLAQRVIARFHLGALSEAESGQYIEHRLAVAGLAGASPFERDALRRIHQLSRGVPRRINLLCDRAMLGAYASGQNRIGRAIVDKAAGEVFDGGAAPGERGLPRRVAWVGLGMVAGAALVGLVNAYRGDGAAKSSDRAAIAGGASGAKASGPRIATSVAAGASAAASAATPTVAAAASAAMARGAGPGLGASAAAGTAPALVVLSAADLATRFDTLPRDDKAAWRDLARAWGLSLDEADPCAQAQRDRVYCFRGASSTLALIRQLDRPGIVTLVDQRDRPVHALLTGLSDRGATLRLGDNSQTITLASLANLWRGDFSTLWRAPPGYAGKVVDGSSGPLAGELAAQLAKLQGDPAPADGQPVSDVALKGRVAAFQLAQGLKPDGLAGPTTFMQLNRATGVAEPRLRAD